MCYSQYTLYTSKPQSLVPSNLTHEFCLPPGCPPPLLAHFRCDRLHVFAVNIVLQTDVLRVAFDFDILIFIATFLLSDLIFCGLAAAGIGAPEVEEQRETSEENSPLDYDNGSRSFPALGLLLGF